MVPEDLRYTKEHEWVGLRDDVAVIGITDHAQSELGDITFVELPSAGQKVKKGESIGTVESVKAASDIYAPVSGTVSEVNESLEDSPEDMNASPYEKGWICKLSETDLSEIEGLMSPEEYKQHIQGS